MATTFIVYNIDTAYVLLRTENETAAKALVTRRNNKVAKTLSNMNIASDAIKWAYTTREDYDTNVNVMVPTTNMLGAKGNVVMIKKSQLGGYCDPATETYHSR
jgi:hypothetical protein